MPVRASRDSRRFSLSGSRESNYLGPGKQTANRSFEFTDSRVTSQNLVGWKSRIASGQDCTTSLFGVRHLASGGFGNGTYRQVLGSSLLSISASGNMLMEHVPNPSALPGVGGSLVEQALTAAEIDFYKKFNAKTSAFDSGTFMGEIVETARMLSSPARAMRESIDSLHRLVLRQYRRNDGRKLARGLAGTWLEWQYGVKPLVSDLDNAAKAFRAMDSGRQFDIIRINGRGNATSASTSNPVYNSPLGALGWGGRQEIRCTRTFKQSCDIRLAGAWRNSNPSGQMPLPDLFSVGLRNVLPTAYELFPWSFFADYFSNLGDVLGAWCMRSINFAWLNQIQRDVTSDTYSLSVEQSVRTADGTSYSVNASCRPGRAQRTVVSRSPYDNSWSPTLRVKIPGIDDGSKWLNITALLAMAIRPHS